METNDYDWADDLGQPKSESLPPGPWQDEPDKEVWIDEATGLDCMIIRGPVGALCGYVGVPRGHSKYGKNWDDVPVDVHGGLTYANKCGDHICHVPQEGRPDDVWWLGFDCAHMQDIMPAMGKYFPVEDDPPGTMFRKTYKTIDYVRKEVTHLAQQLSE